MFASIRGFGLDTRTLRRHAPAVPDSSLPGVTVSLKAGQSTYNNGLDFADAERVFAAPTFTFEDDREDYGEQRWVTLGLLSAKVVVIVHTETAEEIRVISRREADKDEQFLFFTNL